ncbi:transcriptional regulator [Actinobacillus succinogenes]|nr:helix-turn-helix domain-containing protein [Actinobacillus succinogenes]PHI40927.1 transcriptional regulator [Actinobacillus succinogenes]
MKKISAIDLAMKLVGGKWKCLILYHLYCGDKRPRDLLQLLEGISQKVLTEQLRQLEGDGLIARRVYSEVPPRVEYRLTDEGAGLEPALRMLCDWSRDYDSRHGNRVEICFAKNEQDTSSLSLQGNVD